MDYHDIVASCEEDLDRYGDSFQGAGWTKTEAAADLRYDVMLDLLGRRTDVTLLDFGCGTARLLDYAERVGLAGLGYNGLDLSHKALDVCRAKYPARRFYDIDVLTDDAGLPVFDYVIMNGIFYWKGAMTQSAMIDYFRRLLVTMAGHARLGLAFNVMSTHVAWQRDDLFHLPLETATDIVAASISRRFVLRQDYCLYEYTLHVHL